MSAILKSEIIEDLHTKVANDAYALYEALAVFVEEDEVDDSALPEIIEQCTEYVQSISTFAEQANLTGLLEVCELTKRHLIEIELQDKTQRKALCQEVERWPRLISNYLYAPTEYQPRQQLIAHLQHSHWHIPLSSDNAEKLTQQLATDFTVTTDMQDTPLATPSSTIEESNVTPLHSATSPTSSNIMTETEDTDEVTEELVSDSIGNDAATMSLPSDTQELSLMLDEASFDDALDEELAPAVEDIDSLPETLEADSELILDDESLYTTEEMDMPLEEAMQLLQATEEKHLVDIPEETKPEEILSPSQLENNNVLIDLSNQLVDLNDTFSTILNNLVTADDDSEQFLDALENYTNTVQILWEKASTTQLEGLQKICMFINDNIFELSSRPKEQRFHLRELFVNWPRLTLDYLQNPQENAAALAQYLNNTQWPLPLTEAEANSLQMQLIHEVLTPQMESPVYLPSGSSVQTISERKTDTVNTENQTISSSVNDAVDENMAHLLTPDTMTEESDEDVPEFVPPEFEALFTDDTIEQVSDEAEYTATESTVSPVVESGLLTELSEEALDALVEDEAQSLYFPSQEGNTQDTISDTPSTEQETTENALETTEVALESEENTDDTLAIVDEESIIDSNEVNDIKEDENLLINTETEEVAEIGGGILEESFSGSDSDELDIESSELLDDDNISTDTEESAISSIDVSEEESVSILLETENLENTENDVVSEALHTDTITDAKFTLLPNDLLEVLIAEVVEASNEVNHALQKFITAENDSGELLASVELYTDNIQSIADAADMAGLSGIQDICQFVNENFYDLSTQPLAIRRASHTYLANTTDLLRNYLTAPLEGGEALVNHCRLPHWSYPLTDDAATEIITQLTKGHISSIHPLVGVEATQDTIEEEVEAPLVEAVTEEAETCFVLADNSVIELLTMQITETQEELITITSQLISSEDGAPELLEAVEAYSEQVQAIWDTADMASFTGLQDICTFINDNVMSLSMLPKAQRQQAEEQLNEWVLPIVVYLNEATPSHVHALLDYLQSEQWPDPLNQELRDSLYTHLTQSSEDSTEKLEADVAETVVTESEAPEAVEEEDIILADPDIITLLIGQIADIEPELENVLDSIVNAEDASTELLESVSNYTENVQVIWDVADMAQLIGLQDVCSFVNDNIMGLSTQDQAARRVTRDVFSNWTQFISMYLHSPIAGANKLLDHCQNVLWPVPLDDMQVEILRQKLLPQSAHTEASVTTESEAAPQIEEAEEIVLADPDILALIIGQLVDTGEELNTTLNNLVNAEDGSEAQLETVETYTEHVQGIWDAADMAGLEGLKEVSTFMNDNIMSFSMEAQADRQAHQHLFANMPELISSYLHTPYAGAQALLAHMQDPQWSVPLEGEQIQSLQNSLLLRDNSSTGTEALESAPVVDQVAETPLAAPEIIELVSNQISDLIEGLSVALKECVSMENDNPAFLEAIETYTTHIQSIWDAADMAGLEGLKDVCDFVNENLMAFSMLEAEEKQASESVFAQWPNLILAYLTAPQTNAPALVNLLQDTAWPMPLEAERAQALAVQLTQSTSSEAQDTAYEAEVAAAVVEEAPAPEIIEEAAEVIEEDKAELDMEDSGEEISLGNAEVLGILTEELESAKEEIAEELAKFISLENGAAGFEEAADNYNDQALRLYAAAEMLGLEGLQAVCTFLSENIQGLAKKDLAARKKAKKRLEAWPDLILAYLDSPNDHVIALVNNFREDEWASPLPDEAAHAMLNQLAQGSSAEEEEEEVDAYARPQRAEPENVDLEIPEDVNPELLEAYLQETPQHAADFSECIQNIIADPQVEEIQKAQRIAHTLKGSSNILGIKGIAFVGHHLEDTLEYLAEKQVIPPKELTDTMVEAADCIELMVETLLGQDDAPENALDVAQAVLDWANRIDKGDLTAPAAPTPSAAPAAGDGGSAPAPAAKPAKKKAAKKATPAADASPESVLRVPTSTIDELMRLVGELSISQGQIQERLKHVMGSTRVMTEQNMVLQQKTFALENLVDVRGITGLGGANSHVNVQDEENFDPLEFEEYNELHSVAHSFIESIADNRELGASIRDDLAELENMIIQQERLNKEFQSTIMTTRMVPATTLISKLQRNVRQTCRMTGKKADLDVEGSDILMDSDVVNNLADPLQHIIRNAIDHGLEMPDERVLLQKPEAGTVMVRFYREGNNIIVSCQDDGQGLNYANIRYTAIQRGLITEDQELSEIELARLILMSGFSTKSGVTQVSGRGVGMDVVHTNIRQMKGTLDLTSKTGEGTTIIIKLPMSLVTVHVLLVRIGKERFGIPTNNLEQALAAGTGEYQRVGNVLNYRMGKNIYEVKSLSELLHLPGDYSEITENDPRPVVLVREETGVIAVLIDELIDGRDLVLKNMGKYVSNVRGVAGASILGDGTLVPILDLPELLRSPMQASIAPRPAASTDVAAIEDAIPHIMVVDDSLSVRKAMTLLLEDAGFEVLIAKDGLEAIEVIAEHRPKVMLVDMEMPRMNGLELTAHIRANDATKNIPIFMITSRTTEKHREQARTAGVSHYLTKPYQDTELLDLVEKALAGGF